PTRPSRSASASPTRRGTPWSRASSRRRSRRSCWRSRSCTTTSASSTSPPTRAVTSRRSTRCRRSGAGRRARSSSGCSYSPPSAPAASARNALVACFFSTAIAALVLAPALVHHDFSFVYVASHTSRDLSTIYALSAFWGGQEGSLLLWLLVLSGYGALAVVLNQRLLRDLIAWVVPVVGAVASFFAFALVAASRPPPPPRLGVVRPSLRRSPSLLPLRPRRVPGLSQCAGAGGRRPRAPPDPQTPFLAPPPADAVPRLRRADDPVRVRGRR